MTSLSEGFVVIRPFDTINGHNQELHEHTGQHENRDRRLKVSEDALMGDVIRAYKKIEKIDSEPLLVQYRGTPLRSLDMHKKLREVRRLGDPRIERALSDNPIEVYRDCVFLSQINIPAGGVIVVVFSGEREKEVRSTRQYSAEHEERQSDVSVLIHALRVGSASEPPSM